MEMNGALRQLVGESVQDFYIKCLDHRGDWYFDYTTGHPVIRYLGKLEAAPEGVKVYKTPTTTFFASENGRSERDPDLTRLFGPRHSVALAAVDRRLKSA